MNTIIKLVYKDFIRFTKDRPAFLLTFVVPVVLIIIFANIFGDGKPAGKVPVILVNESKSIVAKYLESKIDSSKSLRPVKEWKDNSTGTVKKIDEEKAKELVKEGNYSAAIVMPNDFFTDTSSSLKFKYYYDPKSDVETAIIQGEFQKTIMTQMPRLMPLLFQKQIESSMGNLKASGFKKDISRTIGSYFNVSIDSVMDRFTKVDSASLFKQSKDTSKSENFMGKVIKFENKQLVGAEVTNPGLTRTVGGWAIMFLLFSITGAASSLFEEKSEGSLKRILCMPVNRSQILWSKYIYSLLLGVIQLSVLFFISWAIYKVDIFSNFFNLVIMIVCSSAAAVAFGMFITSIATTNAQASGYSTLLILVMSALGGSWFPITLFPEWMQHISKFTLTYWSVEGFVQVLWRQAPFSGIIPEVAVLVCIAILVNLYSLKRFKQGKVFK